MKIEDTLHDTPESEWATVTELSKKYNVSGSTIRRWLYRYGDVRFFRESNTMRIHREEFTALVDKLIEKSMNESSGKE